MPRVHAFCVEPPTTQHFTNLAPVNPSAVSEQMQILSLSNREMFGQGSVAAGRQAGRHNNKSIFVYKVYSQLSRIKIIVYV